MTLEQRLIELQKRIGCDTLHLMYTVEDGYNPAEWQIFAYWNDYTERYFPASATIDGAIDNAMAALAYDA